MTGKVQHETAQKFAIFRAKDSVDVEEAGVMSHGGVSETTMAGVKLAMAENMEAGNYTRCLFSMPGFSLLYAWFKSEYPLPRHTHDSDCLYYILGGSLKLGSEELVAGDGFFLGSNVPYTYTPGPDGVEVLEFRGTNAFDIKLKADNMQFWERAAETVRKERTSWAEQTPPAGANNSPARHAS